MSTLRINRERFRIEMGDRRCPLGNTDMFRFVELLVGANGTAVDYMEIAKTCMDDENASNGAIRNLKFRVAQRLRKAGMSDVADAIVADKEHYRLDLDQLQELPSRL
jgi:hypothetical protein